MKRLIQAQVTQELLEQALHLPEGHKIVRIFESPRDIERNTFHIIVEGEKCPRVAEGEPIPEESLEILHN